MKIAFALLFTLVVFSVTGQDSIMKGISHFEMNEIVILKEYEFRNEKEREYYKTLERDIRKLYPIVKLISSEYERINIEMQLYDKKRRKDFLKWYEQYARKKYMPLLGTLTLSQGQLLLKLIDRELGATPYHLIKTYRSGFRAIIWQGVAFVFMSNLDARYNPEKNPMIEHVMTKIESEFRVTEMIPRKKT